MLTVSVIFPFIDHSLSLLNFDHQFYRTYFRFRVDKIFAPWRSNCFIYTSGNDLECSSFHDHDIYTYHIRLTSLISKWRTPLNGTSDIRVNSRTDTLSWVYALHLRVTLRAIPRSRCRIVFNPSGRVAIYHTLLLSRRDIVGDCKFLP